MKKPFLAMFAGLWLAACSYPYAVRDGGDGVYYAESPPAYTYVDGYFGFPYYGPYSWSWYYPLWYTPLAGPHYSWYRPTYYWGDPFNGFGGRYAYVPVKRQAPVRSNDVPGGPAVVPLPPADFRAVTVRPPKSGRYVKHAGYPNATYKSRAAAKVFMPVDRSSSMPVSRPSDVPIFSRSRPMTAPSAPASRPSQSRVSRSKN